MSIVSNTIAEVQYSLLRPEHIIQESTGIVNNSDTSQRTGGIVSESKTINNNRLGTTDNAYLCATCSGKTHTCPGHPGHIVTNYPLKDPMSLTEITRLAKGICLFCSYPYSDSRGTLREILDDSHDIAKHHGDCHNCGNEAILVEGKGQLKFFYDDSMHAYNNDLLKFVLSRCPEYLVAKNGNRPLDLHLRNVIVVPAVNTRPDQKSAKITGSADLTNLLKFVVMSNNELSKVYTFPDFPVKGGLLDLDQALLVHSLNPAQVDKASQLEMAFSGLIKGPGPNERVATNQGKPMVSLVQRLNTKGGFIRQNILGKRASFMIRSVLIGSTDIEIDEIGIAKQHAMNVEIIETVTPANLATLQTMVSNAKTETYPFASRVNQKGRMFVTKVAEGIVLNLGDTVYRNLIDGDYVNLNRQPSLIFTSISSLRAKIIPDSLCIMINPSICALFNADFDGDQGNIIISQCLEARKECEYITAADRWFISPQKLAPLVGAFQDALIGLSEMTLSNVTLQQKHLPWMLERTIEKYSDPAKIKAVMAKSVVTGRELVSALLPKINFSMATSGYYLAKFAPYLKYDPKDINIVIKDGILVSGSLEKNSTGQGVANSIFHIIANEYGNKYALGVAYNLQQLTNRFLMIKGFTIGLKDMILPKEIRNQVKTSIKNHVEASKVTMQMYNSNVIPVNSYAPGGGIANFDFAKDLLLGDDYIAPIMKHFGLEGSLVKLLLSGSKGKIVNVKAMLACGEQVYLEGNPFHKHVGGRVTPYYTRNDPNPAARGFIEQCFAEGIPNGPYAFMAGEARQTLISNALSTSITGYANRVAVKILENVITDNMFRASKHNGIFQNLVYDCGFNIAHLELVSIPTIDLTDEEFKEYDSGAKDGEFAQLARDRQVLRESIQKVNDFNALNYKASSKRYLPFNPKRVIENNIKPGTKIARANHVKTIAEFCESLNKTFTNPNVEHVPDYALAALETIKIAVRAYFAYNKVKDLSAETIQGCLSEIKDRIFNALPEPGLPVGIMCAQFMYEPLTQYILDSKHRAGARDPSQKNVVVRTDEIINARPLSRMKMSSMTICVKDDSIETAKAFAKHITTIKFGELVDGISILFEEFGSTSEYKDKYIKYSHGKSMTPWCIRYSLSLSKLAEHDIDISDVAYALEANVDHTIAICDAAETKPFIRVFINASSKKETAVSNFLTASVEPEVVKIQDVPVRGVPGIISATVKTTNVYGKESPVILTNGSNLKEIVMYDIVDPDRVHTDSIIDTFDVYGIFAARERILSELTLTIPNTHNFSNSLIADVMTSTGTVTGVNKSGLQTRELTNVALRASLQTPANTVYNAAAAGITEKISTCLSGSLFIGSVPNVGSAYNQIIIDHDAIEDGKDFAGDF